MPKKYLLIFLSIIFCPAVFTQNRNNVPLYAFEIRDSSAFCWDWVYADSSGYLYAAKNCGGEISLRMNRYELKTDTIFIEPFDFVAETPFLEIRKTLTHADKQVITFLGSNDVGIYNGMDSSFMLSLFKGRRHILTDQTHKNNLTFKQGQYEGMEIIQLSKIFGVPIILWIKPGFDYVVKLNMPSIVLQSCIGQNMSLNEKYLLIRDGKIIFPNAQVNLPIQNASFMEKDYSQVHSTTFH